MCAAPNQVDIFDTRRIRKLIDLMKEQDLSELSLEQADQRMRICRGGPIITTAAAPGASAATALPPAAAPTPPADEKMLVIKSPMVGTFYRASGPDAVPFIKVGDRIGPEKTVCIIEAMKVFNEIPAGVSGQVVAILVENGAPIEFGQPLVKIDPDA